MIKVYTIGFTQKNAKEFFNLLVSNSVKSLVDTRISNNSQLAGFAKSEDLAFFSQKIGNMHYSHNIDLAPTKDLLTKFRKKEISWDDYEIEYLNLLDIRKISSKINYEDLNDSCFLCSEHTPEHCHRRLLVEYLQKVDSNIEIKHLY